MKTLTIDYKTWLRGQGASASGLLKNGKSCCLGFLGRACGVSDEEMFCDAPHLPTEPWPKGLWAGTWHSAATKEAMEINDDTKTTDAKKEALLRPIFLEWGYRLRFINRGKG